MKHSYVLRVWLLAVIIMLSACAVFDADENLQQKSDVELARGHEENKVLWQIGKSDNNTAEFAHGPKDYQDYRKPGIFIVGQSDPKRDWPYVQPGIIDGGWAPGGPQAFDVYFGLKSVPAGPCRLLLDLVDTHSITPPKISVVVNDKIWEFQMPKGSGDASVFGEPAKGREHLIEIPVPANALRKGNNHITITTLNGSWILWDALRFTGPENAKIQNIESVTVINYASVKPVLVWHKKRQARQITFDITHIGEEEDIKIRIGKSRTSHRVKQGSQKIDVYVPEAARAKTQKIEVFANKKLLMRESVEIKPVRKWEVHLVHQTHLDIGYTAPQEEVLDLQVDHLYKALEYIDKSKDYPEHARFKWHPEGMWAVDEFMRRANDKDKARLVDAARKRLIHIDSMYAQAMTGIYSEEELFELMTSAKLFCDKYDVTLNSATQSDVPGYTWGLVSALAHNGIKYISVGPNPGHRLGSLYDLADAPFYWVSPSGKEKVLFLLCSKGYGMFHGKPKGHRIELDVATSGFHAGSIASYLSELEKKEYPYDMVMLRYCIEQDNGSPNPVLSDVVKEWNEKYAYPKLIISRNSEYFELFEKRYSERIPVRSGDITPYWEDGAASTSADTAVNRRACERIVQAQILWSMLKPEDKLHKRFDAAWEKMIMYDEHTWGAWNSISDPDSAFVMQQAEYKSRFASDGAKMTEDLLGDITGEHAQNASNYVDVYNTASWKRSELVLLSPEQSAVGDQIRDEQGKIVPSQRLGSGELAFAAEKVPAFGGRRYVVSKGNARVKGTVKVAGVNLSNDKVAITIDKKTGAIKSLVHKDTGKELVDSSRDTGINDYLYILGRDDSKGHARVTGEVKVTVEDAGPLVGTLRIESGAPGCSKLTRIVRIVSGSERVELTNITDKLKERRPEGVYFEYPFNIPGGISKIDIPWATCEPEKDQMEIGANRNYYCVQRWVDVSNDDYGVTWVTVDAPMLQFHPIKIASVGWFNAKDWRSKIEPGQTFYSWVMNNHWETNYKADQEGIITFKYVIAPHKGGYDAVKSQKIGRSVCQPLIIVAADPAKPVAQSMLKVNGDGVVVTSIKPSRDGKALMVRLFNTAQKKTQVRLSWHSKPDETWISNPMEEKLILLKTPIQMVPHEIVTLRIEILPGSATLNHYN